MKKNWYILSAIGFGIIAAFYYALYADLQEETVSLVIHVGILPDESMDKLRQRYDSLLAYLADETGFEFKLVPASDYSDLLNLFTEDKVDLAYFGGFTFLQAVARHHAVPLVMREVDTRFTSYFLVAGNHTALDLSEFRDKTFSFGSRLSTSGHLMPRYFLNLTHRIDPERFFSEVRYSGAHDKTAYQVRDGIVDLGVANSQIIKSMFNDGRLNDGDLRVIWETPPYPDYVWAVHGHMPEGHRIRLQDAFLELDINDAVDKEILKGIGARIFLPAGIDVFHPLQQVAESLDMLRGH